MSPKHIEQILEDILPERFRRKKLFRPDEVAQILNVNKRKVYRLVDENHLIAIRFGGPGSALRIPQKSLQSYIERSIINFSLKNSK